MARRNSDYILMFTIIISIIALGVEILKWLGQALVYIFKSLIVATFAPFHIIFSFAEFRNQNLETFIIDPDLDDMDYLISMDPYEFESYVAGVFKSYGYETEVTPSSGDGGVDIFLKKDAKTAIVQCKRFRSNVPASVVRELSGTLDHYKCKEAFLVTTGISGKSSYEFVKDKPINIIDRRTIISWIDKGVNGKPIEIRKKIYFWKWFSNYLEEIPDGLIMNFFVGLALWAFLFFPIINQNTKKISSLNTMTIQNIVYTKTRLNLRKNPNGAILFTLNQNQELNELSKKGNWSQVEIDTLENNWIGWVYSKYLIDRKSILK